MFVLAQGLAGGVSSHREEDAQVELNCGPMNEQRQNPEPVARKRQPERRSRIGCCRQERAGTPEARPPEEALRESEERYRRIVETTHEGIWMADLDGLTTFVNPRCRGCSVPRRSECLAVPSSTSSSRKTGPPSDSTLPSFLSSRQAKASRSACGAATAPSCGRWWPPACSATRAANRPTSWGCSPTSRSASERKRFAAK